MQVYKRSAWVMFRGIIMAPCAGFVVYLLASWFTEDARILFGAAGVVALLLLYSAVFGEHIRFELDTDGELRYYRKGRLNQSFDLKLCRAGYRRKSDGADHNISLQLVDDAKNDEVFIDCSPLGLRRFDRMYEAIKAHTWVEPEVMRAAEHT